MQSQTDRIKKDIRSQAASQRDHLAKADPQAAGRLADQAGKLLEYLARKTQAGRQSDRLQNLFIAGYWPIKTELDPRLLLAELRRRGQQICLPVTPPAGQPLIFYDFVDEAGLAAGPYGTRQPDGSGKTARIPDLILAPLLAFDGMGGRLGYGGGYYDRTLAELAGRGTRPLYLGLAFRGQHRQTVPTGPLDQPLDGVLCPDGWAIKPG